MVGRTDLHSKDILQAFKLLCTIYLTKKNQNLIVSCKSNIQTRKEEGKKN